MNKTKKILGLTLMAMSMAVLPAIAQNPENKECKSATQCVAGKQCKDPGQCKDPKQCKDLKQCKDPKQCKDLKQCKDPKQCKEARPCEDLKQCNNPGQCKDSRNCKAARDKARNAKKQGRTAYNPYQGLDLTEAQKSSLQQLDARMRSERKAKAEARKADRRQLDSAARVAQRAERIEARKKYLEEVKTIVGPGQYVVFLENMYVNSPAGGQKAKAFKGGKHGRPDMHRDGKGKKMHARK